MNLTVMFVLFVLFYRCPVILSMPRNLLYLDLVNLSIYNLITDKTCFFWLFLNVFFQIKLISYAITSWFQWFSFLLLKPF